MHDFSICIDIHVLPLTECSPVFPIIPNAFIGIATENCIDDNILSNEIKIIARTYIKKKIGLKPSTIVEIIRI